jgi:transglutaminase-like putative cysteine protease
VKIRIGYEIIMSHPQETPISLMLSVHPSRAADLVTPDDMRVSPATSVARFMDSFGNICTRLIAPAGQIKFSSDAVISDPGTHDAVAPNAIHHVISDLPHDCLQFLLGSRYCETDKLMDFAWSKFNAAPSGWARVQAICDFVHNHLTFGYPYARNSRTAFEAFQERVGVCRDFAHLAITLCRCMNIPARYATGYLGDIGVPKDPAPMDFSAWFEVYLGGQWYMFDARHNRPRIGRVLIARGRDAADVAIATYFGPSTLVSFRVWTDEMVAESSSNPAAQATELVTQ